MQNTPPPGQPPYENNPSGQPPYGGGFPPPNQPPPYGGNYPPPPNYNTTPPGYAPPPPITPKKKGLPWWGWGLIIVSILAIVSCGGLFALGIGAAATAKTDGDKVVDQFLQAAASNNIPQMQALVAPSAQDVFTTTNIQNAFLTPTSEYLPDYQSLESNNFNLQVNNGQETLELSGTVKYKTKSNGTFIANLEKVNGNWRIININVYRPS